MTILQTIEFFEQMHIPVFCQMKGLFAFLQHSSLVPLQMAQFCVSLLLILLSGDVELNPGPPKRAPGVGAGPPKPEKTKEEQLDILEAKVS